ncbi:DUF2927 domain-containing protein [Thioclava pacifica]|uniref:DUF2927 domain-containing protein n=1 Tax=Thioclava pacifica DSM 10166 TaxID=1353537 RepID=A0A074J0E9_9RHOB|nr:DUF2927 domain-containing protein [Thioclava pacifica]KEO50856.1 hypothetical protein TP2_13290 [Thioclava pacifica DSM 10166]
MRHALTFAAIITALSAAPLFAEGLVRCAGKLSDRDFYRAVACEAKPGGACKLPTRKWFAPKRRNLTVAIKFISPRFPDRSRREIHNALLAATHEINAVGADLRLSYVTGTRADIEIFLSATATGGIVRDTGDRNVDGTNMETGSVARVTFFWQTHSGQITDADIVFSKDILSRDIRSVVLEELTQSLGFSTDIVNPYYTKRSIFSEDGNVVTTLRGQDAMALRTHYPLR